MASIIYKPQCGACGHFIDFNKDEIACQTVYVYDGKAKATEKPYTITTAIKCPHCGAYFDSMEIELPKKH